MGASQYDRTLPALLPESVTLDGRSERRLLAQSVTVASLFHYFDGGNRIAGQWSTFFENVPMVRYAEIAEYDTDRLALEFKAWLRNVPDPFDPKNEAQFSAAWSVCDRLLGIFERIQRDYAFFQKVPSEFAYADSLAQAITLALADNLRIVWRYKSWLDDVSDAAQKDAEQKPDDAMPRLLRTALWNSMPVSKNWRAARAGIVECIAERLTYATWSTHSVLVSLVDDARRRYAQMSAAPSNLSPYFAMYLSFVRQFAGAQAALNSIPGRHLDYFYQTVLGLAPGIGTPDQVYLSLQAAAPDTYLDLPVGFE